MDNNNYYILSSFISFWLLIQGCYALFLGLINFNENRKSNMGRQMLYMLACTFVINFGYAWMGLCYNNDFAYVARAIALCGVFLYLYFLVRYITAHTRIKSYFFDIFYFFYLIAATVSWLKITDKTTVKFTMVPWGYWYESHMNWGRTLQFTTIGVATLVFLAVVIIGIKKSYIDREKNLFKRYLWFIPILYAGYALDTIVPSVFNTVAFPASPFALFVGGIYLYNLSRRNKAYGVSEVNVSEYVFKDVTVPIFVIDHVGKIALFNQYVHNYFGEFEYNIVGMDFMEFLTRMGAEHALDDKTNGDESDILRCENGDGSYVEFKLSSTIVYDNFNEPLYSIYFVQDITREQHYISQLENSRQEAEDANTAKSNFLANMSHEIRTPMNAIIGMSEIILQNYQGEPVTKEVSDIKKAADNLLCIINDILDISKIEAGKYEIIEEDFELASLINDVSMLIKVRLAESKVSLKLDIEESLPRIIYGDQARIRQILLNILGNAVKFTKEGSVTLKAFWNNDQDNPVIKFDIIDTGIGIEKDNIDKIFGAFDQVDTRRNRSIQGTGLGLAISRQLSRLMGGEVTVESVYGKGSTFHITLCVKVPDYVALGEKTVESLLVGEFNQKKTEEKEENIDFTGSKVLVVDDIDMNLAIASGLLQMYGIEADTALSGKEAIEKVKGKDYDLIFMDHMMPEMDGIDTTKAIRALDSEKYKNIPVVALTANAINDAKELLINEGMQDFLAKPIEVNELKEVLKSWLKNK